MVNKDNVLACSRDCYVQSVHRIQRGVQVRLAVSLEPGTPELTVLSKKPIDDDRLLLKALIFIQLINGFVAEKET